MALSTSTTARWTILSSNTGIPSGRCRPSGFGIYTLQGRARPVGASTEPGVHFAVRVDDGVAFVVVDEPDRQRETQLAPLRRRPLGPLQPAGQKMQLGFL